MAGSATIEAKRPPADTIEFDAIIEASGPWIIDISTMESDASTHQRTTRFIGEVMASRTVEDAEKLKFEKPINSLRDGIHWAAKGDVDAIRLVDTNVETDMIERTLKSGHVMDPVPLTVLPGSKIMQYNQLGDAIQKNSLQLTVKHKILGPRTKAETRNHFRDEDLHREGWYENYSKLVISLGEDDSEIFFTDTMSCSLQLTSKDGNNLQLESAFVAGIAKPGAKRHDLGTVIALGDMIGIDFRGMTIAEIIATPILIHNSFLKNGVIDVVENLWDKAAAKVLGKPVFFGEAKQAPCSYLEYRERCRERTKTFRPKVELVRQQLINEKDQIQTRVQAIKRLHQLSEEHMIEKAVEDHSINPRVFGPVAAERIFMARYYAEQGQLDLARRATKQAVATADSKSCPWARSPEDENVDADQETSQESDEDCEFVSDECPECGEKDVKTVVRSLGKGKGRTVTGSCGCSKTYRSVAA